MNIKEAFVQAEQDVQDMIDNDHEDMENPENAVYALKTKFFDNIEEQQEELKDPLNLTHANNQELLRDMTAIAKNNASETMLNRGGKAIFDVLEAAVREQRPMVFREEELEVLKGEESDE